MAITEQNFAAANRQGRERKATFPTVAWVRYDGRSRRLVIGLSSGLELAFSPKHAQGFEHAHAADLREVEISPSGHGIHFPRIDADLYLPGLLAGFLGAKNWMAAEIGRRGGQAASTAKASAARMNGRLGGRPRKQKIAA